MYVPKAIHFCVFLLLWGLGLATVVAQSNPEAQLANEYYLDGEYERALPLYEKLLKKEKSNLQYIQRGVECHLKMENPAGALAFLQDVLKRTQLIEARALEGNILLTQEKRTEAESFWRSLISQAKPEEVRLLGNFFVRLGEFVLAEETYLTARKREKSVAAYSTELIFVYRYQRKFAEMVGELVNDHLNSPSTSFARQWFTDVIVKENADELERALLQAIQKHPNDNELQEWLYTLYVRSEQFAEAITQGVALSKKNKESGERLFKLAQTLQDNKAYALSNQALAELIRAPNNPYYVEALNQQAKNSELLAFERRPLDTLALRQAVQNYDVLIQRYGRNPQTQEIMYRKARLLALYLRAPEAAKLELASIEGMSISPSQKANARLLMGDVLLFQNEVVKARLQYQQVSDDFREDQIGAQARYRLARLDYYLGNFAEAKAFLKILKENTTNDISNDAIRLYLKIQDNTGMDTSTTALARFAHAELLLYQGRKAEGLALLDSVMYAFPGHPLLDDILLDKALSYLDEQDTDRALTLLNRIVNDFSDGILADNALFMIAEIYQDRLKDKDKAIQHYMRILIEYPASILKVEARKRIRELRGEKIG